MLLHIPDVLTADEVSLVRTALQDARWQRGQAAMPEAARIVQAALARNAMFFAAALPLRSQPPQFQRCVTNEALPDTATGALRVGLDGQTLRADVSATLFVSATDDYDGGELLVDDIYGQHEVRLEAGDLALYSAASAHRIAPMTRGARLSAVFSTQSMVRDDFQRNMLFDLDRTIQALRARVGDGEETVALTSHYHNLLRHWAQT